MTFSVWLVKQDKRLDKEINKYIDEAGLINPNISQFNTKKNEQKLQREIIKKEVTFQDHQQDIDQAIKAIFNYLPDFIKKSEWDEVLIQLSFSGKQVEKFWRENEQEKRKRVYSQYEIMGITQKTLKHFYELAEHLLNDGHLIESKQIFIFLTVIAPLIAPFWLGLGRSYQFLDDPLKAIEAYKKGKICDPTIQQFSHFLIECYEKIGDESSIDKEKNQVKK